MQYRIKEVDGIFRGQRSEDGELWVQCTGIRRSKQEVEELLQDVVKLKQPIYHEWKPKVDDEEALTNKLKWILDNNTILDARIDYPTKDKTYTLTILLKGKQ